MPMLFLSGATIPAAILPDVGADPGAVHAGVLSGERLPGDLLPQPEHPRQHRPAVGALLLTTAIGLFLAVQLFRWEKEEKLAPRKKLWVLAVLAPFLVMGCCRAYSKEHIGQNEALFRDLQRSGTFLIRNARVFMGDGKVIENGAVLVRDGKIVDVFEGAGPDAGEDAAPTWSKAPARRCCPGLIDAHVHLSVARRHLDRHRRLRRREDDAARCGGRCSTAASPRRAAWAMAWMPRSKLRGQIANGSKLGAQLFICGPMFTAEGGHGTEFTQYVPQIDAEPREGAVGAHSQDAGRSAQAGARTEGRAAWTASRRFSKRAGARACSSTAWICCWSAPWPRRRTRRICRWPSTPAMRATSPTRSRCGRQFDRARLLARRDSRCGAGANGPARASISTPRWRWPKRTRITSPARPMSLEQFAGAAGGLRQCPEGHARLRGFGQGRWTPPRRRFSRKAFEQSREQPAARLEGRRAAGDGHAIPAIRWCSTAPRCITNCSFGCRPASRRRWRCRPPPATAPKLLRADNHIGAIRKGMDADLLLVDGNPLQDIARHGAHLAGGFQRRADLAPNYSTRSEAISASTTSGASMGM